MINYQNDIFVQTSSKPEEETFQNDFETEVEYIDDDPLIKPEMVDQDDEFHLMEEDLLESQYTEFENTPKTKYRNTYKTEDKLEAVTLAEKIGNRKASKVFSIDESCIRKWRTQKELLKSSSGRCNIKHPKAVEVEPVVDTVFETVEETIPLKAESKQEGVVKNRKSYSSGEKLEAVKYAEVTGELVLQPMKGLIRTNFILGNRQAAKIFSIDESCIRKWRQNKEMLIEIHQERGTKRKPNLHWPDIDRTLKEWVLAQMASGIRLKPSEIKTKAIEIAETLNITNFKGTSSYIFKFMMRYHIPGRTATRSSVKKRRPTSTVMSGDYQ